MPLLLQTPLPQTPPPSLPLTNIKKRLIKPPPPHNNMLQPPHRIPQHPIRQRTLTRRARRAMTPRDPKLVRVVGVGEGAVAVEGDVGCELVFYG